MNVDCLSCALLTNVYFLVKSLLFASALYTTTNTT